MTAGHPPPFGLFVLGLSSGRGIYASTWHADCSSEAERRHGADSLPFVSTLTDTNTRTGNRVIPSFLLRDS